MTRLLPFAIAAGILLVSGLLHGLWSERWGRAEQPAAFAARLPRVPLTVGDWEGRDLELDPKKVEVAELSGYLCRQYVNRRDHGEVTLILVAGRAGPVAAHPPDVCYAGSGFELTAAPAQVTLAAGRPAQFWTARFRKGDPAAPLQLRVFWGWTADGDWQAPRNARLALARHPALYKLYLVRQMGAGEEAVDKDPGLDFLRVVLPELQKVLFFDQPAPVSVDARVGS
jgi:Protein of unknown function (DUF3485)